MGLDGGWIKVGWQVAGWWYRKSERQLYGKLEPAGKARSYTKMPYTVKRFCKDGTIKWLVKALFFLCTFRYISPNGPWYHYMWWVPLAGGEEIALEGSCHPSSAKSRGAALFGALEYCA